MLIIDIKQFNIDIFNVLVYKSTAFCLTFIGFLALMVICRTFSAIMLKKYSGAFYPLRMIYNIAVRIKNQR